MAFYTIRELTKEFEMTPRTLRYYEEIGLLQPTYSESGRRKYSQKDRTRLYLIQRGKHLGFNLQEIKEMINLFTIDRTGEKQLKKTIEYGNQKIEELEQKINELTLLKKEIVKIKSKLERTLSEIEV
ncbi:MerR family transcriptional regulator [Gottfriedia solisilvae]|uniref:MerR family transcriptional regulator n=1 Tax=Gottfriedia solisilvae TaxID=1516104 RepID=A0A8J3EZX1_9BACI|nr:MerR family transcriptional regulator [Gottfriedia solisilvae]GGI15727.1 MerR family transcriptional regulator [Gottfriedia solisilvae]